MMMIIGDGFLFYGTLIGFVGFFLICFFGIGFLIVLLMLYFFLVVFVFKLLVESLCLGVIGFDLMIFIVVDVNVFFGILFSIIIVDIVVVNFGRVEGIFSC